MTRNPFVALQLLLGMFIDIQYVYPFAILSSKCDHKVAVAHS